MKTTIDHAGRVVIPAGIRHEAGLVPGKALDVRYRDGRVEIEPDYLPVRLVRKNGLLVAVPVHPIKKLTQETVNKTVRALRTSRTE